MNLHFVGTGQLLSRMTGSRSRALVEHSLGVYMLDYLSDLLLVYVSRHSRGVGLFLELHILLVAEAPSLNFASLQPFSEICPVSIPLAF